MMQPVYTTVIEVEKGCDTARAKGQVPQGKWAAAIWMSGYI